MKCQNNDIPEFGRKKIKWDEQNGKMEKNRRKLVLLSQACIENEQLLEFTLWPNTSRDILKMIARGLSVQQSQCTEFWNFLIFFYSFFFFRSLCMQVFCCVGSFTYWKIIQFSFNFFKKKDIDNNKVRNQTEIRQRVPKLCSNRKNTKSGK